MAIGSPSLRYPTAVYTVQFIPSVVEPMTLMSIGLYNEPAGAWLPSILF
jgi:hypothetical protein